MGPERTRPGRSPRVEGKQTDGGGGKTEEQEGTERRDNNNQKTTTTTTKTERGGTSKWKVLLSSTQTDGVGA